MHSEIEENPVHRGLSGYPCHTVVELLALERDGSPPSLNPYAAGGLFVKSKLCK